jgi:triphosphoribosyl-dephospho-CoA synthase
MSAANEAMLAAAFESACLSELEAIKPGNVHIFADGHGMVVQDFVNSAAAASAVIAQPGLAVGQRILSAVEASWDAVGCNTNLGIVLLCAPLLHAVLNESLPTLQERLQRTLRALTVTDAAQACRAIVQASPAGLGDSARHDVRQPPEVSLLELMQEAQQRDRIAWQYAHDFADVFEFGARRYRETLLRWERPAWATASVYLGFLARFPDTHVERKHGVGPAQQLRAHAEVHDRALLALDNPKRYLPALLDFDAELKTGGINPGTSADLAVASLLVVALENMMTGRALS